MKPRAWNSTMPAPTKSMARTGRIERRTPVKGKRGTPRKRKHEPNEPLRAWIRLQPCVIAGKHECIGVVQCCHRLTRGARNPDEGNMFAGCVSAHDEQGRSIVSFERKYGVNLRAICARLYEQYERGDWL